MGVAIATPAVGPPNWSYLHSLLALDRGGGETYYTHSPGYDGTAWARQRAAEWFLKTDADWLMQIDTDCILHPGTFVRLASWQKPIICPLAFQERSPVTPYVFREENPPQHWPPGVDLVQRWLIEHPEMITPERTSMLEEAPGDALIVVRRIGTHCVLVHRSVFEQLPPPWFVENPDKQLIPTGGNEDFMFSAKCEEAGIPMHVDLSVTAAHGTRAGRLTGALDFMIWNACMDWQTGKVHFRRGDDA